MRVFELTSALMAASCSLGVLAFSSNSTHQPTIAPPALAANLASMHSAKMTVAVATDQTMRGPVSASTVSASTVSASTTGSGAIQTSVVSQSHPFPHHLLTSVDADQAQAQITSQASPSCATPSFTSDCFWDRVIQRSLGETPRSSSYSSSRSARENTDTLHPHPLTSSPTAVSTIPATRPSTPTPVNAATLDQTYTLGPGDIVQVSFFNVPEYSGQQTVLVDGSLNLPALGRISVAGMTLTEAETAIITQFKSELRYPQVTVTLIRSRPLQVGVIGEVNQPGIYVVSSNQETQLPGIAQLIQIARGTTQAADLERIEIRRPRRSGSPQIINVNLWAFLRNGDLSQNVALRDGDTVVIPATTTVNLADTNQLAASNLAGSNQILDVALVGEVLRPGAYKLGADSQQGVNGRPTLTRAIQAAGGITPSADLQRVEVRRPTRSGETQLIQINLWQLLRSGDLSQDIVLQQGDTIQIPTARTLTSEESAQLAAANLSPTAIRVNVVGPVERPGIAQLPANTTLNQAILAAGGLNRRARRSVELVRLNPDGTATRRMIEVDLARGVDPMQNPILQDGDSIVVRRNGFAAVTDALGDFGGLVNSIFLFRIFGF